MPNQDPIVQETKPADRTKSFFSKYAHYLWEFLMLFLAVFCGYLAQSYFDYQSDRSKEREYIQSMVEDLQIDTGNLTNIVRDFSRRQKSMDTIFTLFENITKGYDPILDRSLRVTNNYPSFVSSDRTIQQLKSSGGMRVIRNKKAADGIINYDASIREFQINIAYVERFFQHVQQTRMEIQDLQSLDTDLKKFSRSEVMKNGKSYLFTKNPDILGVFRSKIYELQQYFFAATRDQTTIKTRAGKLIELLKQEYQLSP
jgi:hypothetical protein